MSYKTIVVHLDAGPRCAARVGLAAGLARRFGSRLVGIAPTGLADVILTMNSGVPDSVDLVSMSSAYLRGKAEAAAAAFERVCKAGGVASFESRVVVDEAVDAVVLQGRCSDLVVVGQTDRSVAIDGVAFDFPQQVLLHGGTPVLVVPYAGAFGTAGKRVLVAWKNTREAARALRDARPLLHVADCVALCEIAESGADPSLDDVFGCVAPWLAAHGIKAEMHRDVTTIGAADHLLSRAADFGADLIVSGGYGHSRLREWVLGGMTRHLLDHMTVPTLMSH